MTAAKKTIPPASAVATKRTGISARVQSSKNFRDATSKTSRVTATPNRISRERTGASIYFLEKLLFGFARLGRLRWTADALKSGSIRGEIHDLSNSRFEAPGAGSEKGNESEVDRNQPEIEMLCLELMINDQGERDQIDQDRGRH